LISYVSVMYCPLVYFNLMGNVKLNQWAIHDRYIGNAFKPI